eukprot:3882737-Rhodomonas_salina.1
MTYAHHLLEEILHHSFNHSANKQIVHMNGKVRGLPRKICAVQCTKIRCAASAEANATRADYPAASTTVHTVETELW